ncbi:MAG: toprim domain-containing protein [Candidatus Micrarchaeota archaeon]
MELKERLKKLAKLFERLREGRIFVEGKKDRGALEKLGFAGILTISGNLRQSCERAAQENAQKVFVLSDLDRRGDELAKRAWDELGSLSIRADTETRRELAHLLRIRCFEDAKKAYDKLTEEMTEKGENNG